MRLFTRELAATNTPALDKRVNHTPRTASRNEYDVNPARSGTRATLEENLSLAPNENTSPPTSPSLDSSSTLSSIGSGQPSTTPEIQVLTPLKKRFLREVTMSPASRTPARKQSADSAYRKMSSKKDAVSPQKDKENVRGRESPTKHRLEVGQNGFYYSCEIPLSKVVSKSSRPGTPGTLKKGATWVMEEKAGMEGRGKGVGEKVRGFENGSPVTPMAMSNIAQSPFKSVKSPAKDTSHQVSSVTPKRYLESRQTLNNTSKTQRSTNMGELMAGLTSHTSTHQSSPAKIDTPRGKKSLPPTPLRKAAERSGITVDMSSRIGDMNTDSVHPTPKHEPIPLTSIAESSTQTLITGTSFLNGDDTRSEISTASVLSPSRPPTRRVLKRRGTDPVVLLALQDDMEHVKRHIRSSSAGVNGSKIPTLTNYRSVSEETKKTWFTSPVPDESKSNSMVSKLEDTPTIAAKKQPNGELPTVRYVPQCKGKPSIATPARKYTRVQDTMTTSARPTPKPRTTPLFTPGKPERTVDTQSTLDSTHSGITPRVMQLATPLPAYARPTFASSVAARNPSTPGSASKGKTAFQTVVHRTPKPAVGGKSTTPRSLDPIRKSADAVEIARRIGEWNNEDRKKAAIGSPKYIHETRTPKKSAQKPAPTSRTPAAKSSAPKTKPSYTLEDSPAKSSIVQPPKSNLQTPAKKKPIPTRLRPAQTPRTSAQSKIARLDPNAFRTPSKDIESSLDRAIDAKIEEDAKSGKDFTAGGNRISDLMGVKKR